MPNYFGYWKNGFIQVNGTNLSDHAREMTFTVNVADLPANTFGDTSAAVSAGLQDWGVEVTFLQDFAAGKVDQILFAAGGTAGHFPFNIEVGADSVAAISSTNPRFSGNVILSNYRPFGGQHGSNLEATASFKCAGNLTRRTS